MPAPSLRDRARVAVVVLGALAGLAGVFLALLTVPFLAVLLAGAVLVVVNRWTFKRGRVRRALLAAGLEQRRHDIDLVTEEARPSTSDERHQRR